jgi:hypothetical protein
LYELKGCGIYNKDVELQLSKCSFTTWKGLRKFSLFSCEFLSDYDSLRDNIGVVDVMESW